VSSGRRVLFAAKYVALVLVVVLGGLGYAVAGIPGVALFFAGEIVGAGAAAVFVYAYLPAVLGALANRMPEP
jgi:hypothetical protein